jgi:hypothetical protein
MKPNNLLVGTHIVMRSIKQYRRQTDSSLTLKRTKTYSRFYFHVNQALERTVDSLVALCAFIRVRIVSALAELSSSTSSSSEHGR